MRTRTVALASPTTRFIEKSALLSRYQVMKAIPVIDVVKVLNQHKIRFILVGAHGMAGWRQTSRATEDVDVVVMARHQKKAAQALLHAFPDLEADDQEVVTRLRDKETRDVLIDLMKTNQPLYGAAFKHSELTKIENQPCNIPTLEMALAMKFAPMISLNRAEYKKLIDASDFRRIVEMNPEVDLDKLSALGELVYPGGGKELLEKVRQVRAGEKLKL